MIAPILLILVLLGVTGCRPELAATETAADAAGARDENSNRRVPSRDGASDDPGPASPIAAGESKPADVRPAAEEPAERQYETVSRRGEVVWLADVLQSRYGIKMVPEARESTLALESTDGRIYPMVEDRQGRAFRLDERLRDRPVELLVRHYRRAGMIRVIRVYAVKPAGRFQLDYWCDVCSISMIEDGPCDCCQQPNRLRERPVEE